MKTKNLIKIFADPLSVFYYLGIAAILAVLISYTYRKTHKSVSYSQTFVTSLVMLLPIVSLIISVVNNNVARAIGVFGAFSITRFRTPIKDSRDMVYIFWSLAVGLAIGAGETGVAVSATLLLSALAFALKLTNYGTVNKYDYLLIYNLNTKKNQIEKVNSRLGTIIKEKEIVNIQSDKKGENIEINLHIKLRKGKNTDNILELLNKTSGIGEISITPIQNGIEF